MRDVKNNWGKESEKHRRGVVSADEGDERGLHLEASVRTSHRSLPPCITPPPILASVRSHSSQFSPPCGTAAASRLDLAFGVGR